MNWDQIETKWADMARRIQVEWPFRPIFVRDNSVNDKRPDVPAVARTAKAVAMENPTTEDARLSVQIQGVESSSRGDQPSADYDTRRSQA